MYARWRCHECVSSSHVLRTIRCSCARMVGDSARHSAPPRVGRHRAALVPGGPSAARLLLVSRLKRLLPCSAGHLSSDPLAPSGGRCVSSAHGPVHAADSSHDRIPRRGWVLAGLATRPESWLSCRRRRSQSTSASYRPAIAGDRGHRRSRRLESERNGARFARSTTRATDSRGFMRVRSATATAIMGGVSFTRRLLIRRMQWHRTGGDRSPARCLSNEPFLGLVDELSRGLGDHEALDVAPAAQLVAVVKGDALAEVSRLGLGGRGFGLETLGEHDAESRGPLERGVELDDEVAVRDRAVDTRQRSGDPSATVIVDLRAEHVREEPSRLRATEVDP